MPRMYELYYRNTRGITLLVVFIAAVSVFLWGDYFLGKHAFCFYYSWCGIPCPFCGLTRAVYEFMHLKFNTAFLYNPLIYPLVMWFVIELVYFIWYEDQKLYTFLKYFRWFLLMLTLIVMLLRIFKYFPLP